MPIEYRCKDVSFTPTDTGVPIVFTRALTVRWDYAHERIVGGGDDNMRYALDRPGIGGLVINLDVEDSIRVEVGKIGEFRFTALTKDGDVQRIAHDSVYHGEGGAAKSRGGTANSISHEWHCESDDGTDPMEIVDAPPADPGFNPGRDATDGPVTTRDWSAKLDGEAPADDIIAAAHDGDMLFDQVQPSPGVRPFWFRVNGQWTGVSPGVPFYLNPPA